MAADVERLESQVVFEPPRDSPAFREAMTERQGAEVGRKVAELLFDHNTLFLRFHCGTEVAHHLQRDPTLPAPTVQRMTLDIVRLDAVDGATAEGLHRIIRRQQRRILELEKERKR